MSPVSVVNLRAASCVYGTYTCVLNRRITHHPHVDISARRESLSTRALANASRVVSRFDSSVDKCLAPLRKTPVVRVVEKLAHCGDAAAIWLTILAALALRRPRPAATAAAVLIMSAMTVNGPVKAATSRPRPEPLPAIEHRPRGSSFPSGHSFSSWCAVAMLPTSLALRAPAAAVAAAIASSRVFLRYHFASDVVVGSTLGAVCGLIARRAFKLWR